MHKSQKGLTQLLIPRSNAATWFEVVAEALHLLAYFVEVCVLGDRGGPIALGRDHRHNVLRDEVRSDTIAVIPFVHNRMRQRLPRRQLGDHGLTDWTRMTWPCGEDARDA